MPLMTLNTYSAPLHFCCTSVLLLLCTFHLSPLHLRTSAPPQSPPAQSGAQSGAQSALLNLSTDSAQSGAPPSLHLCTYLHLYTSISAPAPLHLLCTIPPYQFSLSSCHHHSITITQRYISILLAMLCNLWTSPGIIISVTCNDHNH